MDRAKIIITLPRPCLEDWELMTPADRGRFCASCQKTVIDFTRMSDAEVIKFLRAKKGDHHCGHFHHSQLGREITEPPQPSFFGQLRGKIAASLLLFQTVSSVVYAQVAKQQVHHQHKTPVKSIDKRRGIKGYLRDNQTNNPIAKMKVFISGTHISCTTDIHGYFFLPITDSLRNTTVKVQADYTELSEKMPAETTIPYEEVKLGTLTSNGVITLYRCTIETNKEVLIRFSPPLSQPYTVGGVPTYTEIRLAPVTRHSFWPFHRKRKKKHEE